MVRHEGAGDTNRSDDSSNRSGKSDNRSTDSTSDDSLARFAADARMAEAVRGRSRERWLRQQATESTTLAGACWSLAEAGHPLALTTVAGRVHHGTVGSLGTDFISLRVVRDREVLVPLDMVATMAPSRRRCPTGRAARRGMTFAEALAHLAADRPNVTIWTLGLSRPMTGELVGVGADVALVGPAEDPSTLVYARLGSVCELSVIASG
jgi:hypothetical protein